MVNNVNGNNGVSGALTGLAGGVGANDVGFDTFLKLLVTQLKNQDPLNPMEGTEFTSQIAQFSQLEQTIQGNSLLQKLTQARDYGLQALAVGTIGREVLVPGVNGVLNDGNMDFGYKLEDPAMVVKIEVIDETGAVVRTMEGSGEAGAHTMAWDGKDDDDVQLEDGFYGLRISARDIDGNVVPGELYTYAMVTEVTNDGAGNVLVGTLDGRTARFEDVLSIRTSDG